MQDNEVMIWFLTQQHAYNQTDCRMEYCMGVQEGVSMNKSYMPWSPQMYFFKQNTKYLDRLFHRHEASIDSFNIAQQRQTQDKYSTIDIV